MTDPVKLKPIAPSFAPSQQPSKSPKKLAVPMTLLLVFLVVAGAFIAFQFVPTTITVDPTVDSRQSANNPTPNAAPSEVELTMPFEDIELQRAQDQAREILTEFAALQDKVETERLGLSEHRLEYDQIIDAANAADAAFARRDYFSAIEQYQAATQRLDRYVNDQESTFSEVFTSAMDALVNRNFNDAQQFLEQSTAIKPNDPEVSLALDRLKKLPEVNVLIREAKRALLAGEFDAAESNFREVLVLDPETQGIDEELRQLAVLRTDTAYKTMITQAYAALNSNDVQRAKSLFESALLMRPGESAATMGLKQVDVKLTNTNITELKATAERHENAGRLRQALQIYKQVLEVDANLQFALDGQDRIGTTVRLTAAIERVLADPAMLSSDKEFTAAQELLTEIDEHDAFRNAFENKIDRFASLLETASKPLEIVLVSDNELDVRLATVGNLGAFDRKTLSLRPGRYLITGSANGCRDVRKTVVVEEGMEPVAIVCTERI